MRTVGHIGLIPNQKIILKNTHPYGKYGMKIAKTKLHEKKYRIFPIVCAGQKM